jgi:hypothetical protein
MVTRCLAVIRLLTSSCSFRSAELELENCFNPIPWAISLCGVLVDVLGLGISGSKSAVQVVQVENSESVKMEVTSIVLHMLCREIKQKSIITRHKLLPVPSIFAKILYLEWSHFVSRRHTSLSLISYRSSMQNAKIGMHRIRL